MSKASIKLASNGNKKPVDWAETGVAGYYGGDQSRPILGFTVEINSLEDLARISTESDEELIVDFNPDGTVAKITIYDDYVE